MARLPVAPVRRSIHRSVDYIGFGYSFYGQTGNGQTGEPSILKLKEEIMRVVKVGEVEKENFFGPLFTGSDVTRQALWPDSQEYNLYIVNFGKGVRNKFHAHDREQPQLKE